VLVVGLEAAKRLDERVLRELLGSRRVAEDADDDGEDRPLVPADELLACFLGSGENPVDQLSVGGSRGSRRLNDELCFSLLYERRRCQVAGGPFWAVPEDGPCQLRAPIASWTSASRATQAVSVRSVRGPMPTG
jgi:hypothetical protein